MSKSFKTVLVVDDDPGVIKLLEKWLHVDGYKIIGALSGKAGIERAHDDPPPDCILLDLMIPDINGADVARALQKDPAVKDIPIIFITVTMGVENDKGDEEIDIDGVKYRIFAKPLHNRKLLSTIRKSINKRANKNV